MRQTDCLAFVRTYYEHGMDFFEPRVLSLQSTDGKAIGEFPILYYVTAIFYKIVGEHEFILRLINIILVTTGFFFIYKLLLIIISDITFALSFTLLFFSSTILIYYTNNYLPDAGALGLTLMGWYFFYRFLTDKPNLKIYIISIFLFTLSALIKITYGLNLAAASLTMLIYLIIEHKNIKIKKFAFHIILLIISYALIIGWYIFVIQYNRINDVGSFLTNAVPIWSINELRVSIVWDYISNYWYTKFYYESTIHFLVIVLIIGLIFIKRANQKILIIAISTTIGSVIYFLLFYGQFSDHDYYFIAIIPMIIFTVINSFIAIRNKFPKIINNIITKVGIVILVILSLNYAREKVGERYDGRSDKFSNIGFQLNNADKYIDSLGIPSTAKFIVFNDYTPNGSLYFLNRSGWTYSGFTENTKVKSYKSVLPDADYILLTTDSLVVNNHISEKLGNMVGEFNGSIIYSIRN